MLTLLQVLWTIPTTVPSSSLLTVPLPKSTCLQSVSAQPKESERHLNSKYRCQPNHTQQHTL